MFNFLRHLTLSFNKMKIKKQLYLIYLLAIFVPITILGTYLIGNTGRLLVKYHEDLIESNNQRVKTILFEIASQIYNISEEMSFNANLTTLLTNQYDSQEYFLEHYTNYREVENYTNNYAEIENIYIYTNNPTISGAKQILTETDELLTTDWYQQALSQSSVIWTPIETVDKYGNHYWNLCLVRQIPLVESPYHGVLVIKISDNYLRSRLDNQDYDVMAMVDDGNIFYSSKYELYGSVPIIPIDYDVPFYQYTGLYSMNYINDDPTNYLLSVTTLSVYGTAANIYVCSINGDAYKNLYTFILSCILIVLVALIIPGILIHFFTTYFTNRVITLQDELHKASNEDYDIITTFNGKDELSEAFHDLQTMVQNIKLKDADMYQAKINEEKFKTEQQIMEFKILASQINPHFLYNTLETIRMKALTSGNRDVANSIKLLGKSMRYVLDNTGSIATTLKKEVDYTETYLKIQKLRFHDRINFFIHIDPDLNTKDYEILPLLLQPVVENSIIHGLEDVESNGEIHILINPVFDDLLEIHIRDNGHGMTDEQLTALQKKISTPNQTISESIGLYNIHQRIRLYYGENYGLKIESKLHSGTLVSITLPLRI